MTLQIKRDLSVEIVITLKYRQLTLIWPPALRGVSGILAKVRDPGAGENLGEGSKTLNLGMSSVVITGCSEVGSRRLRFAGFAGLVVASRLT